MSEKGYLERSYDSPTMANLWHQDVKEWYGEIGKRFTAEGAGCLAP